jgi:hypothetical protein
MFSSMSYDMNGKIISPIILSKAVFKSFPTSAQPFAFFVGNVQFSGSVSD